MDRYLQCQSLNNSHHGSSRPIWKLDLCLQFWNWCFIGCSLWFIRKPSRCRWCSILILDNSWRTNNFCWCRCHSHLRCIHRPKCAGDRGSYIDDILWEVFLSLYGIYSLRIFVRARICCFLPSYLIFGSDPCPVLLMQFSAIFCWIWR